MFSPPTSPLSLLISAIFFHHDPLFLYPTLLSHFLLQSNHPPALISLPLLLIVHPSCSSYIMFLDADRHLEDWSDFWIHGETFAHAHTVFTVDSEAVLFHLNIVL